MEMQKCENEKIQKMRKTKNILKNVKNEKSFLSFGMAFLCDFKHVVNNFFICKKHFLMTGYFFSADRIFEKSENLGFSKNQKFQFT